MEWKFIFLGYTENLNNRSNQVTSYFATKKAKTSNTVG